MFIIIDSSMLMLPAEKKINLSYEFERLLPISFKVVVPEAVLDELKLLIKKGKPSIKQKANLALQLSKKYQTLESKTRIEVDLEIERLAIEHEAIVATNDSELRLRLRRKGISVIAMYGKNRLELFGDLI
ncbi:hypothetical protein ES705_07424 [subsurface metagenome]